jgi:hypothetical protein
MISYPYHPARDIKIRRRINSGRESIEREGELLNIGNFHL